MPDRILTETRFLRCIDRDGWTFVERPNVRGVVVIVAITAQRCVLIVEQYRPSVRRNVIELPAGLAGDEPGCADEDLAAAARRELHEETGYEPGQLMPLAECASSPGLTNEIVSFFLATKLTKVGDGGGTSDERIQVHEIPLADVRTWLQTRTTEGALVSAKVYAGLFLILSAITDKER